MSESLLLLLQGLRGLDAAACEDDPALVWVRQEGTEATAHALAPSIACKSAFMQSRDGGVIKSAGQRERKEVEPHQAVDGVRAQRQRRAHSAHPAYCVPLRGAHACTWLPRHIQSTISLIACACSGAMGAAAVSVCSPGARGAHE